ncbi:MAG TPA: hypothetical protein VGX68_14470 [Thermoanaerobaculia bacterium]|nr:hypothetical protein [Thermoanaerobaculia bacterium]
MNPGIQPGINPDLDEEEVPPDPAAVEGERRSRELDPWGVMAFELSIVLKGLEKTLGEAMAAQGRERVR